MTNTFFCVPSALREEHSTTSLPFWHHYAHAHAYCRRRVLLETHAISLITEGTKQVIGSQEAVQADQDALMILKAGKCLMTEQASGQQHYGSLLVFFDSACLLAFLARTRQQAFIDRSSEASCRVLAKTTAIQMLVQGLVSMPTALLRDPDLARIKTEELFHYIIHASGPEALTFLLGSTLESTVLAFRRMVEQHATQKLGIDDLAFLCNMSVSTFKRHFEKIYGTSPARWLVAKRLEEAAVRLRHRDVRPAALYEEAGFESLSAFIHAFKRQYGMTPGQFQGQKMNF